MRIREYASWDLMLDKAESFFREISQSDRICLIHHGDADGVTCAIFIYYLILDLRNTPPDHVFWVSTKSYDMKEERELIKNLAPDILIVVDLDLVKEDGLFNEWSLNIPKIFIYDHHSISKDINMIPNNIIYLNARMLNQEGIWHPASFFGYEIARRFFETDDYCWIAGVGLRGDHAHEEYPEFFEKIREKFPILFLEVVEKEYKSILEGLTHLVNAGFFYHPDAREKTSFLALKEAFEKNDPMLFFEGTGPIFEELRRKSVELKKEIKRLTDETRKDGYRPQDLNLVIHKVKTPHYIVGVIAGNLCKEEGNLVCAIANEFDENMGIELRMSHGSRINFVEILQVMREQFNFLSAGGHPVAAGCLIRPSQYEEFKMKFESAFREHIKGR
ncbi:MAG: DHHA1 domain-containing protein [bacterium]|nr:DHHA1 domain-containing protein [bacterium]